MHRTLRLAALGLFAGAVALTAPAAAVAAPVSTISATAAPVQLGGNPWSPGGNTYVTVHNGGAAPAKGFFEVITPEGTELGATDICDPVTPGVYTKMHCGGDVLPAGGDKRYLIRLNSTLITPDFATTMPGNVAGLDEFGQLGARTDYAVTWPARTQLRLAVKAAKPVQGRTRLTIKATNLSKAAIQGYSLDVITPANAAVVSSCGVAHLPSVDCEVFRSKTVQPGATDTFTVTVEVTGKKKADVVLRLSPVRYFANKDAKATLKLAAK